VIAGLLLGLVFGVMVTVVTIAFRWWTGAPTTVTASGSAVGPLRSGGWGILLGSVVSLLEVLAGKRLADTWGVRIVLSSVGSMVGGLLAWRLWVAVSNPAAPAGASANLETK